MKSVFRFLPVLVAICLMSACHPARDSSAPEPQAATAMEETTSGATASAAEVSSALPSAVDAPADAIVPINDRHYAPAVMRLIDSSQTSLRVCLYQVRFYTDYPNSLSNQLIDKLILARRRGVDVEVIVDTSPWKEDGAFDKQNQDSATRLVKGGCRLHLDSTKIQSHQKMLVADGMVTVVASANWSHYSLSSNREVAVMIWSEPVAAAYTAYFADRLKEATAYNPPVTREALILEAEQGDETGLLTPDDLAKSEGGLPVARDARVTTLNNRDYYPRLHDTLAAAEESVSLIQDYALWYATTPGSDQPAAPEVTPRAVPSQTNLAFDDLVAAGKRGVHARACFDMTNYEDGGMSFSGEDFANRLWALGVKTYYDDPNVRIHAKMLNIDGDITIVGSTNWSFQAFEENNECSVRIDSKTLGAFYGEWVDSIFAKAHPVVMPLNKELPRPILPPPKPLSPASNE